MRDWSETSLERDPTGCPEAELRGRLKRAADLQHLLQVYETEEGVDPQKAPIWEAWLRRTGELPPDFDALPTSALLPEVLRFNDGSPVGSPAAWQRRRREVLALLEHWQLGECPPPPAALAVEDHGLVAGAASGGTVRRLCLVYGPSAKAVAADMALVHKDPGMYRTVRLNVELFIPDGPGPFPALVTMGHRVGDRLHGWLARQATARGYVVCAFDREDAGSAEKVYTSGFAYNELGWWAYGASRCIDHLGSLPSVDPARIAIAGHSRGAKMAMVAAVYDQRVAAAVISHPGSGAGMTEPWRYLGEKFGGETLEYSTRVFPYWNPPRLRFFAGRENKLPFDAHFMVALMAPRPMLMTEGDADDVGETWGGQQAFLAAREVYALLGKPDSLNMAFQSGGHHLPDEVLSGYVDWLDMRLGRRPLDWSDDLMYTYTFDTWCELTGEEVDPKSFPARGLDDLLVNEAGEGIDTPENWAAKRQDITERVMWALGELPERPTVTSPTVAEVASTDPYLRKGELALGDGLVAHLTYPAKGCGPFPVAIYLHAYIDTMGWAWSAEYGWTPSVGERLAQRGFLAVEYDQLGYGRRNHDAGLEFYRAHPQASVLGAMVQDLRRVIDALGALPLADAGRIAVAGYSLGGMVALYGAALDERIAAVATTCGFGSMRLDAHGRETEGLMRYSHLRSTLPRLGFFVGHEAHLPYDYHDLLALIAPRPVFVLAPLLDQDWRHEDVRACCQAARPVYELLDAAENLTLAAPNDFNRYPPKYQDLVNDWLWARLGQE